MKGDDLNMIVELKKEEVETGKKSKKKIEVDNFYKDIAQHLKLNKTNKVPLSVTCTTEDGCVEYLITMRSGTVFIREVDNTMPESYVDCELDTKFLTYVDPDKNSYKFYKLQPDKNKVKASYGRMGVEKGEVFGERSFEYPVSMFWIKYYEKVHKGYTDRSNVYITDEETSCIESQVDKPKKEMSVEQKLFMTLKTYSSQAIDAAEVKVPITKPIVDYSKKLISKMRFADSTEQFNKFLLELISVLQRPVHTGNGSGVRDLMAKDSSDFGQIISRECVLLDAMEGLLLGNKHLSSFNTYGIKIYKATEKQEATVISKLPKRLQSKVRNVYRVIPTEQKKRFD